VTLSKDKKPHITFIIIFNFELTPRIKSCCHLFLLFLYFLKKRYMSSLKLISSKMVTRINVILETILILSMRIFYIKLIRTEYSLSLIQCNFSSANNIGRTFKLLNFKLKKGKSLSRYTKNFIIFTSFYPCQDSKSQHFVFNIFIINRIEL